MLWTDSLRETYAAIYKTVKTAKPSVPVGWHIWHNNSFNPIYRAEQDLHELSIYSDFIKVVMYNNCGGERMALYADNIGSTLYGDLSKQSSHRFELFADGIQGAQLRPDSANGSFGGLCLSRDETRAGGRRRHEDSDLAGHRYRYSDRANNSKCTPESVKEAVPAAFRAGAPGVLLLANIPRCGSRTSAAQEKQFASMPNANAMQLRGKRRRVAALPTYRATPIYFFFFPRSPPSAFAGVLAPGTFPDIAPLTAPVARLPAAPAMSGTN